MQKEVEVILNKIYSHPLRSIKDDQIIPNVIPSAARNLWNVSPSRKVHDSATDFSLETAVIGLYRDTPVEPVLSIVEGMSNDSLWEKAIKRK